MTAGLIILGVLLVLAALMRLGNRRWTGDELMQAVEALCWCFAALLALALTWSAVK